MMWGSIVKLLDEIVIAAIISILGFICGKTYKKIRSFFYKRAMSFSIDGLWYSRHNNFQGENIIEIIQFKQNREDVLFKLIQYKEHKKNRYTFRGRGVFTTDVVSLFYCSDSKDLRQNGVMTLKISSHDINDICMKGTYYEINSERAKSQGFYPFGAYEVYKLKIPFLKRGDLRWNRGIFLNYKTVDETVKKYGKTK